MIRNVLLAASLTALIFTGGFSYAVATGKLVVANQAEDSGDYLEEIASVKRGR